MSSNRVSLRLSTRGDKPPELPLKMEYDIVGVETTLFVSPSAISACKSIGTQPSLKINRTSTVESDKEITPSEIVGKLDKDMLLRNAGIVPLKEKANQEKAKGKMTCCDTRATECRDAFDTISCLSSKVESMFCGGLSHIEGDRQSASNPLLDLDDDDSYEEDFSQQPYLVDTMSSESTIDWDTGTMSIETTEMKSQGDHMKIKIVNGDESLQKILDKVKVSSIKVIKEDRDKPLRGVAYLQRFKDDNAKTDILNKIDEDSLALSDKSNVDKDIVNMIATGCANTNLNGEARSENVGQTFFNLNDSPHWSTCSEEVYGCDNRDATNTLGIGASATISKDCNSFSTSGTSPEGEGDNGTAYAYGNVVESRTEAVLASDATRVSTAVRNPTSSPKRE